VTLEPGPLAGFRIVEACQMVAGPMATMQLAELGADVIKVEHPDGGDRMRTLGHRRGGIAAFWASVNRGKRSVVLDLTSLEGRAAMHALIAGADAFVQNFRPGVADRLGIGPDAMCAANPSLVYASVSGFGDDGPYARNKSYDYVIQALSGMAALQVHPSTGEPQLVRTIVIDKVTAMTVMQSVLAALLARERDPLRRGSRVDVAMLDVAIAFLWPDGMMQHTLLGDGVRPAPHMADGYAVRRTKDGFIAQMAMSERQFAPMLAAIGRSDIADDPRFATMDDRLARVDELGALIEAEFVRYTTAELVERLHANDVPCAGVTPVDAVHLDPQVVHNELLVEHERPWIGAVREPLHPVRYGGARLPMARHAPALGEHTDAVLAELDAPT
jgi:crotonobetainyl-CoA:carnitine CoA-transferase CaiB-like acyl-CoA transferase